MLAPTPGATEKVIPITPKDKIIYQEDINKNNYDIKIKKTELNNWLFALNNLITDLKNDQNKNYIINEVENIITKLKNSDVPVKMELKSIPTFSTVDLKQNDDNENPPLVNTFSDSQIDNKTYITDLLPTDQNDGNIEKYEGPLINGKKEGKGIYIYKNGCKYEGYFKNDKKEGSGIFYYANGDRYKGNFKEGNYHGKGTFYFNNGDRYEGEFINNKYSGIGKYFYHNGDRFEGQWLDDKKNGQGVYIYLNGDKITGNYYNGKPLGMHIKYSTTGCVYQINYSKS